MPGISCPLGVSVRRCSCAKFASTVRRKSSDWKRGLRKPLGPWPPHLVLGTQSPLLACRRHYPGRSDGICPLERFHSLRPSLDSWRVGSCINDFGACSAVGYLADVSGHGVPSGVLMAMVKSAVRMRLATSSEPQVLLEDLNRVISELIGAEMFVTLAFVSLG